MGERSPVRLRVLAAELRHELPRIQRTVRELAEAREALERESADPGGVAWRLAVYASAALLETFYSGTEKALRRIAAATGGVSEGAGWHRALLNAMTVDVPRVRPAVLTEACAASLERYLAFRHRFRNLYLFDLDASLLDGLVGDAPAVWQLTSAELAAFAAKLEAVADRLEGADG